MKSNYLIHKKYQLHYYTSGNPEKPPLICLHGFMGTGLDWQFIIKDLSASHYVISPDLPAHGLTTVKGDEDAYKMENTASLLIQLLKEKNISRASLLGYSMGGRLAIFLAVKYPQYWQSLILESTSPGLQSNEDRKARIDHDGELARKLEASPFDVFVKEWYCQPIFSLLQKHRDFEQLKTRRMSNDPRELAKCLRMMGTGNQPSLWTDLPHIDIPVLLLVGEFDRKFFAIMTQMQKRISRGELKIAAKSGHNIHFETPSLYLEHVSNFLKNYGRIIDESN